jgi:hypothetical protein
MQEHATKDVPVDVPTDAPAHAAKFHSHVVKRCCIHMLHFGFRKNLRKCSKKKFPKRYSSFSEKLILRQFN